MIIIRHKFMETIDTEVSRIRNEVVVWKLIGIPILIFRTEVFRKGAPISKDMRETILCEDMWECVYCKSSTNLAMDHLIPQIDGGLTVKSNLVTSCKSCNSKKGGRTPDDAHMIPVYGRYRFQNVLLSLDEGKTWIGIG